MSRVLRAGDAGDDVRALQRGLTALGYTHLPTDGVFGHETEGAVERFQKDHSLKVDGIAGPVTVAALANAVPPEMPEPGDAFEFDTAGGDEPEENAYVDKDGWYARARRVNAHPGRVGSAIVPRGVAVHTTDMMPSTFKGLINAWKTTPGKGAAAQFLIGRDPSQGVVQMISCRRNGNHAGGSKNVGTAAAPKWIPSHGNFVTTGGTLWHPNLWLVGIEVHAGGRLGKMLPGGTWLHRDSGQQVLASDVFVDDHGIGWHKITAYQFDELERLLDTLKKWLPAPMPDPVAIQPNGTYAANGVAGWAEAPAPWLVGHVSLDPERKTDPGPQGMAWLRAYAARR